MSIRTRLAHLFRCGLTYISPVLNTKITYRAKFGRKLNLLAPETINEKTLWLKLHTYSNNQLVKQCADKFKVRSYIEKMGCSHLLNPIIGVYRSTAELVEDWNRFPNAFVIKMNIGCGYNHIVFCKDKEDLYYITQMVDRWFKSAPRYYLRYSELQYKGVEPFVLVEEFLGEENNGLPEDYKFYVMNGKCNMVMYCAERDTSGHGAKFYYMDTDWNMIANTASAKECPIEKPANINEAIEYAEKLAQPFPFVRVDLYLFPNRIVFGELTFTPAAGMDVDHKLQVRGKHEDIDHVFGLNLKLPDKKKKVYGFWKK